MKKFLSLLLILVIAAPALGLACHCCPASGGADAAIRQIPHSCCREMKLSVPSCGSADLQAVRSDSPAPQPEKFLNLPAGESSPVVEENVSVRTAAGPPVLASPVPLYLANLILRI